MAPGLVVPLQNRQTGQCDHLPLVVLQGRPVPDAAEQKLPGDLVQVRGHGPSQGSRANGQGAPAKLGASFYSFLEPFIQRCHGYLRFPING